MRTSVTSARGRSVSAGSRWCCRRWCSTISGRRRCSPPIPSAIRSPFFLLAPEFLRFPLTLLATAAAIIASQALISGAFSLTTQAIQLGCLPRLHVRHTSEHSVGQVYVPGVNRMLAVACILLVITFKTSAALAGAYGIAIALTMAITSMLFLFRGARRFGDGRICKAALVTAVFPVDRWRVSRRQYAQDHSRRLVPAGDGRRR